MSRQKKIMLLGGIHYLLPVAKEVAEQVLCLPMHHALTCDEVSLVTKIVCNL